MSELLKTLGSPTEIKPAQPNIWIYKTSFIEVNAQGQVIGWENIYNQFDPYLVQPTVFDKLLGIGSSKDDIYKVLGSPDKIESKAPLTWWYDSSSKIMVDLNGTIIDYEVNRSMKKYFQEKQSQ